MGMFFDAVQVELFSTDIPRTLNDIGKRNIRLIHVAYLDDLTVRLTIRRKDVKQFNNISKYVQKIEIVKHLGAAQYLKVLTCRPVLVLVLALLTVMSFYLPTRILFIEVSGNQDVASNTILEQAQECGIRFGANRRSVRSEQVKNDLLERIPQLKWAAVTTNGSTATIHVQEEVPVEETPKMGVGHIVAACDGIIQSISVTRGTPLCGEGDAVTAGQLLVSGYTDCGISIQATKAEGEIYAQTLRTVDAVAIEPEAERGECIHQVKRYSIQIGKKLIKLYKDSGISDTTCVKIYSEKFVYLPGNKELPVRIIEEQLQYFLPVYDEEAWNPIWMDSCVTQYIHEQMLAGSILDGSIQTTVESGACFLSGSFTCNEMIGLLKSEETIEQYAENS